MPNALNNQHLATLYTANPEKMMALLQLYSTYPLKSASIIKNYHDFLLSHIAFPTDKNLVEIANSELIRITETTKSIYISDNEKIKNALLGSGIAYTEVLCQYSSSIAGWLTKRFSSNVELGQTDATKEMIRNIIQSLMPSIEYENSSQRELGLKERLKFISGLHSSADLLKWLLHFFENSPLPLPVKEILYLQLKVYIRWQLKDVFFSRSFLRWPVKTLFFHNDFLKNVDSSTLVKQKISLPIQLSLLQKNKLLDTMKASLALYYRETDAISYASLEELKMFEMGRGLQIAIVGMMKEKRLALETYIGFIAFKNGVPVSYGGGWIWGHRCKIGVNIYPPFRRAESSWLFCQILRLYYQIFRIRHFVVKPYQFGKGNQEGLKSGAFWFYYKLGFRPANDRIKKAASLEWDKINTTKNYRTGVNILRQFTGSPINWILDKKSFPDFDAGKLSTAVTTMINLRFKANRTLAINTCIAEMKLNFSTATLKVETLYQQQVLENWALLTGLINDFSEWGIQDKKALILLMKLKQTGNEQSYILQLQHHHRLWKSLQNIIG
jgi:hypothetical protein